VYLLHILILPPFLDLSTRRKTFETAAERSSLQAGHNNCIRALSAHLAAEFNISPGRWQHVWLVAIVPTKRWGEMDRNDCHTAWGNFKTLVSSLHHNKNYDCSFSLLFFFFFQFYLCYYIFGYGLCQQFSSKSISDSNWECYLTVPAPPLHRQPW
jgi:hypothetical protein